MMCSLEGDGVCENLYEFVWCKDELSFRPTINIPDTIIYKFGQPVNWYFTGADGKVRKKFKTNIINAKIEETLTKATTGFDVVAYYISWTSHASNISQNDDHDHDHTTIEYFDQHGLREFLFNRWKERNGILQRFVGPKGTRNSMVNAIWSPKLCLLERRVNNRQLHDRRYGIYERCITYDGPDLYSTASPLRGSVLPLQVEHCCESIVAHVSEVSYKKTRICRMSINFKIDSRDRVWMLWSNSIRLASEMLPGRETYTHVGSPANLDDLVRVSSDVTLQQSANHGGEVHPPAIVKCSSCGETSPGDSFHAVHYKTIIAHFEQVIDLVSSDPANRTGVVEWPPPAEILEAAGGIGFGNVREETFANPSIITKEDVIVPPVIRAFHPKLPAAGYARHRRDPLFLYKTALVCEACFLVYAELASLAFRTNGRRALTEHTLSTHFSANYRSYNLNHLKLSEHSWQPLPRERTINKTHIRQHQLIMRKAPQNAPPELPEPIRRHKDVRTSAGASVLSMAENISCTSPHDFIRAREDDFFQELNSGKSEASHPLQHMIAAQRKIRSIRMPQVGPAATTSKLGATSATMSPYEQPQHLVEYKRHARIFVPNSHPSSLGTRDKYPSKTARHATSAARHRQFLSKTLSTVHEQLESTKLADVSVSDAVSEE